MLEQIPGIELSNSYSHQCQMSPTSCHNINIAISRPNHSLYSISKVLSLPCLVSHVVFIGVRAK